MHLGPSSAGDVGTNPGTDRRGLAALRRAAATEDGSSRLPCDHGAVTHTGSIPTIRPASGADAVAAVELLLAARHAAVPSIPPLVHSDPEVRSWFAETVMPAGGVWVAEMASEIVGTMVVEAGWLEQLYVAPDRTGQGIGAALLAVAKGLVDARLDLWTFQANLGARRFYERHGFVEVERTDGDNEEGEPDVRYRWVRP